MSWNGYEKKAGHLVRSVTALQHKTPNHLLITLMENIIQHGGKT